MTASVVNSPLEALTQLSSTVYLKARKKPPSTSTPSDTILLFTWANASPRNIAKYITSYSLHFPSSRILLFTTSFTDVLFYPSTTARKHLSPAVHEIRPKSPDVRIFIHLFSNGGAFKLTKFASLHQDITGNQLPIHAVILDSAPGKARYWKTIAAVSYGLPRKWYLRYPTLLLAHILIIYAMVIAKLPGRMNQIERIRRNMNDPRVVNIRAERCYIYSKTDDLVAWRDVEDHADDAEARGWVVRREEFGGSRHVAHVRVDEGRYWGIVKAVFGTPGDGTVETST